MKSFSLLLLLVSTFSFQLSWAQDTGPTCAAISSQDKRQGCIESEATLRYWVLVLKDTKDFYNTVDKKFSTMSLREFANTNAPDNYYLETPVESSRPQVNEHADTFGSAIMWVWHPLDWSVELFMKPYLPSSAIATNHFDIILETPLTNVFPDGSKDAGWLSMVDRLNAIELTKALPTDALMRANLLLDSGTGTVKDLRDVLSTLK
jgi:hypothetical protein